jgi:hypothetical protein
MNEKLTASLLSTSKTRPGRRVRGILAVVVPAVGLAVALAGVAPAQSALAQDNSGSTISLGGSISDAVAGAVSGIATSSEAHGGVRVQHDEMAIGGDEGLAVADSSGGNHNAGVTSK